MNDLISRSALIEALKEDEAGMFSDIFCYVKMSDRRYVLANIERRINNAPTVEPVRGEWQVATQKGVYTWSKGYARCSACEETVWSGWDMNFCPNCGADMRGEKNGTL